MQRYPLWKGVLLTAIMVAAILLALPNWYGESPALQMSRRDRAAFDSATTAEISGALKAAAIPTDEVYVDGDNRLWARFASVDEQLKARELKEANKSSLTNLLELTRYVPIPLPGDARIDTFMQENYMRADLNPREKDSLFERIAR